MNRVKVLLCAMLCLCTAAMSVSAVYATEETTTVSEEAITEIEDTIDDLEQKRLELQAENERYQAILDKTRENIEEQEQYNSALVSKIEVLDDKIEISRNNIYNLNIEIEKKSQGIKEANERISTQMQALRSRIRSIYMTGNVTDLEIILGARDFSDFLDKMELVKNLSEYDSNLINEVQTELEKIAVEKAELEESKTLLESEEAALAVDQSELNELLEENKTLLAGLYKATNEANQSLEHGELASEEIEKAIAEYYAEKARIEAELEEQRRQEAEKNNQNNGSSGGGDYSDVEVSPSGFVWPTPGFYWLSSEWNEDRGSYNHGAIDIAGDGIMGADTVAAQSGVVVDCYNGCPHNWSKDYYASCGCGGGYGNYVMIDHGNGKMTVYAHFSSIMVYTGQQVHRGQVIGFVGSTGRSTGPHMHFETRYFGVKYNPMTEYQF